jgi:hypothetical protein
MSSLPDLKMYQAAEESRKEQIETLKDVEGIILTMVIQPMPSSIIKAGEIKGGNPMGLTAQNHQCKTHQDLLSMIKLINFE